MVQCAAFVCNNNIGNPSKDGSDRLCLFRVPPLKRSFILKKRLANTRRAQFCPKKNSELCSAHFTTDAFEAELCGKFVTFDHQERQFDDTYLPDAVPTEFTFSLVRKPSDIQPQGRAEAEGSGTATAMRPSIVTSSFARYACCLLFFKCHS